MSKAKAVELWDQLEKQLVRIGLPEDGRLLKKRAELVRTIGDAIGERRRGGQRAKEFYLLSPNKAELGDGISRSAAKPGKTAAKNLPPIKLDDSMPARIAVRPMRDIDGAITAKLAAMLERSCGYSEDDEVGYDRR